MANQPILSFAWPDTPYSVLLWAAEDRRRVWYVNLEDPLERTSIGFDTVDHVLDVLVELDGSSWRWKDEEELMEAVREGLFSVEEAADFRDLGRTSGRAHHLEGVRPSIGSGRTGGPTPHGRSPSCRPDGWDADRRSDRGAISCAAPGRLPPDTRVREPVTVIDLRSVRARFPALARIGEDGRPPVLADAPGGSQVPDAVIEAVAGHYRRGMSNTHGAFATSEETDVVISEARRAAADLTGADPGEVVFGPNATTLLFHLSRSLLEDAGARRRGRRDAGWITMRTCARGCSRPPTPARPCDGWMCARTT